MTAQAVGEEFAVKLRQSARLGITLLALCMIVLLQSPLPADASTRMSAKSTVKIRVHPSKSSAPIGHLQRGQTISVVRNHGKWVKVHFDGGYAFVPRRQLTKRSLRLSVHIRAGSVGATTKAVSVRASGRSTAAQLGRLPAGSRVTLTGSVSRRYAKIVYRAAAGWVDLRYLAARTGVLPKVIAEKVTTQRVVLRKGSKTMKSSGSIARGARIGVTGVVRHGRSQVIYAKKARWVTSRHLVTPPVKPEPSHDVPSSVVQSCLTAGSRPAKKPAGAVEVSTSANLPQLVDAHPAQTTFWLTPGIHRLGPGQYDQVLPRSGDVFIGAPGAVIDGQHKNLYAFGGSADDVTIRNLTIQNFGSPGANNNEGVVNHDSATEWTIDSTKIQSNAGAGAMIGSDNTLTDNCLRNNGQYGFNAYSVDGVHDVVLKTNEIAGNNTDNWEERISGCGCSGGGKFWETRGAQIVGNYVHDNHGAGLWADTNNTEFLFSGNYVADNDAEGIFYEISYNAQIVGNTFVRNGLVSGPRNPGFPTAAIYLSESGSDSRVAGAYGDTLRVADNTFLNNWSGVVGWENADRFAGSPANTSSDSVTMVDSKATLQQCSTPALIAVKPLLDDCRWKTQNVVVEKNVFSLDISSIPGCIPDAGCGFNGVFSNYGTYPDWSPYKGTVVEENVTFRQNNIWRNNIYRGRWSFMAREIGTVLSWDQWRSEPYAQDAGSSINR